MSEELDVYPPKGCGSRLKWRVGLTWRQLMGVLLPFILLPIVFIEDNDEIPDGEGGLKKSTVRGDMIHQFYSKILHLFHS